MEQNIKVNYFYNEDCFVTMEHMINSHFKVDNIITSPPYNVSRKGKHVNSPKSLKNHWGKYDVYQDSLTQEEYIQFTLKLFNTFDKILKKNGVILYNLSYGSESPSVLWILISKIVENTNFTIADEIIWKKQSAIPNSVSPNKLTRICEHIFVFVREAEFYTFRTNKTVSSISNVGQKFYNSVFNFIEAENNDASCDLNKATYSTELISKLIRIYVPNNAVVYDCFMGTGTTANACIKNNINFIGSEISQAQVEYSKNMIKNAMIERNNSLDKYFKIDV